MRAFAALTLSLALASACPGGDDAPADASTDASADGSPDSGVDGPAPPAMPVMTPCPEGWRAVTGDHGVEVCAPFPDTGAESCGPGEAHFPGTPGCTPVGAACPAGDFAEDLPTDAPVLYVLEGATGGSGTEAAPFGTIQDAIAAASAGTVIAIGKGTYDAGFLVYTNFTFWGACAAETILTAGSSPTGDAVLEIRAGNVRVRNLTIGPADRPGLMARVAAASVDIDGVVIDQVTTGNVAALGGGRITARRVVLRDPQNTRGTTRALIVDGGEVEVRQALIEGAHETGVFVSGESSRLVISDAAIRDTRGVDGNLGRGIQVQMGGSIELRRSVIERNLDLGMMIDGPSTATIEDVVIRGTRARPSDSTAGRGMQLQGATVTLSRVHLEDNTEVGLFVGEEAGTTVSVSDLVIESTLPSEATGEGGRGINFQHFGTLTLERTLLHDNEEIGIIAYGDEASLIASDLTVSGTRSRSSDGTKGRGGNFEGAVTVELTRARFVDNHETGMVVGQTGTTLTATDLVITGTRSRPSDGTLGEALSVQFGAVAEISSALFADSEEGGIFVGGDGASLTMTDVEILDTREAACATAGCPDDPFGIALGLYLGGRAALTDFTISRASLCGVQLVDGSELDLHDGLISESSIGVCLQSEGYDITRLQDGVMYLDNGSNLDATSLPVPALPVSGID
jgi:hypothetical protein